MGKKYGRKEFIRSLYLVGEHALSLCPCVDSREERAWVCERKDQNALSGMVDVLCEEDIRFLAKKSQRLDALCLGSLSEARMKKNQ